MTTPGNTLITGAARRIGRGIALALARDGWNVAVHCHRSRDAAEQTARELRLLGVRACVLTGDLAHTPTATELVHKATQQLGPLTCLVNNASLFEFDEVSSLDPRLLEQHLNVNLRAPLFLTKEFARLLPASTTGCVINLLDQKVFNLNPDFLSYTVSKVALHGATHALATALAPRIRVCAVAPGITLPSGRQTEENFTRAHREAPLGRSSTAEDIAGAVRYLVQADAVTGTTLQVDGGQHLWQRPRDVQFG